MSHRRKTHRKTHRRKTTRKSHKTKKTRRTMKRIPKGKRCSDLLKEKIGQNIGEFKKGKFVSIQQAIAVAYKQVGNQYPSCKQVFTKKRKTLKTIRRRRRKTYCN
jgi:hypothetical protein